MILNKLIQKIKNQYYINKYGNKSFSQEGEDQILDRFLDGKANGFYIDVGAHHPIRFSNTYKFYLKGWTGINIDAMPGSMEAFKKIRPKDINLELGVSNKEEILTYFIFNEPALNTFSKTEADLKNGLNGYKIIAQKEIITNTLTNILDSYLSANISIDFISIDVEGLDIQVLESNDWDKYRPKFILIEELRSSSKKLSEVSKTKNYMNDLGYELVAKTYNTLIYKNK